MDQDRIIRFSFPGISLIVTIFALDWIFGGSLYERATPKGNEGLVNILTLIATTPLIGLFINSIPYAILYRCPQFRFKIPPDLEKAHLRALKFLSRQELNELDQLEVKMVHQVVVRNLMKEEALGYTTRRFTFYLTHANVVFSIGISALIVLSVHLTALESVSWEDNKTLLVLKIATLIMYTLYIIAAVYLANENFKESIRFEASWIIWEYERNCNGI
jgi:hypothetical protein